MVWLQCEFRMRVWNVLHVTGWKYMTQKWRKNRHLRTIAQICRAISSQLRHRQSEKNLVKQQYLFQMSSQYGERRTTSGWDRFGSLGHPSKFQRVLRLGFVTAATSLINGQSKFCTMSGGLLVWYMMYAFSWVLAPWRNFSRCKIHFIRPSLAFCYIGSVTARHSSSGRQPNFAAWYNEWNYGTFA